MVFHLEHANVHRLYSLLCQKHQVLLPTKVQWTTKQDWGNFSKRCSELTFVEKAILADRRSATKRPGEVVSM